MAINLDKALGIHPQTLDFRVERSKVLASNLINAETPVQSEGFGFQSGHEAS